MPTRVPTESRLCEWSQRISAAPTVITYSSQPPMYTTAATLPGQACVGSSVISAFCRTECQNHVLTRAHAVAPQGQGKFTGIYDMQSDVRFASVDVAIATVTSVSSPFASSDETSHQLPRGIRTFVVVNRAERWLIVQDQNTTVAASSPVLRT